MIKLKTLYLFFSLSFSCSAKVKSDEKTIEQKKKYPFSPCLNSFAFVFRPAPFGESWKLRLADGGGGGGSKDNHARFDHPLGTS